MTIAIETLIYFQMNASVIDQILRCMTLQSHARKAERRKLALLTPKQRRELVKRRSIVSQFFDDEAIESDGEISEDSGCEQGLERMIKSLRPVDSKGIAFVSIVGRRGQLMKVHSKEFFDLSSRERRKIIRREKYYNSASNFRV